MDYCGKYKRLSHDPLAVDVFGINSLLKTKKRAILRGYLFPNGGPSAIRTPDTLIKS
ncbi:MAG: hypothetical protein ABFC94_05135 [Syntrophomonas sp.]